MAKEGVTRARDQANKAAKVDIFTKLAKTTTFQFRNCVFNGPVTFNNTEINMSPAGHEIVFDNRDRSQTRSKQGIWEGNAAEEHLEHRYLEQDLTHLDICDNENKLQPVHVTTTAATGMAAISTKSNQCPLEEPIQAKLPKALPQPLPLGSTRDRTALGEVSSNLENLQTMSAQSFEANHSAQPYVPSRNPPLRRTMHSHHWKETLQYLPSAASRQKELTLGKNGAGGKERLEYGVSRADLSQFSKQGQSKSAYGVSAAAQPASKRRAPVNKKSIAPRTSPPSTPPSVHFETPNEMQKGTLSRKSRKGGGDSIQIGTGGGGGFAGRAVPKAPPNQSKFGIADTVRFTGGSEVPAELTAEWDKMKGSAGWRSGRGHVGGRSGIQRQSIGEGVSEGGAEDGRA